MNLFYAELRNVIKEIEEFDKVNRDECVEEKRNQVIKALKNVLLICLLARKEGLLALEEYASEKLLQKGMEEVLFRVILLVVDGTDPEYVEDIMAMKYYSGGYTDYDALTYFIYLKGMLSVQKGMNPRIIEEQLLAMLPRSLKDSLIITYEEGYRWSQILSKEDEEAFFKVPPEAFEEKRERFCKHSPTISIEEDGSLNIILASYMISELDDRSMQRVLREIDNQELAVALKGLDSLARTKVIMNLSKSVANLVMEDCERTRWVTVHDVGKSCLHIVLIIIKLYNSGEIRTGHAENASELVRELNELEISYETLESKKYKLHNVMREYIRESKKKRYLQE